MGLAMKIEMTIWIRASMLVKCRNRVQKREANFTKTMKESKLCPHDFEWHYHSHSLRRALFLRHLVVSVHHYYYTWLETVAAASLDGVLQSPLAPRIEVKMTAKQAAQVSTNW